MSPSKRREGGNAGPGGGGGAPGGRTMSADKIKDLEARPYQMELLEKAKSENIIVYLGTGSGKTFVAVMLIKHLRGELGTLQNGVINGGKKIIFLVSSVALVDQQAREIKNCTGLEVGKFCGADGVDDWSQEKWISEIEKNQVFVFVHEVFRNVICSNYMKFFEVALLILDECHHAVGKHPYSMIMDQYARAKNEFKHQVPKVLGLTACVVVKTCNKLTFVTEKTKLERKMDCKVRTTEDLKAILQFVTAPVESFQFYTNDVTRAEISRINEIIQTALADLQSIKEVEGEEIKQMRSMNTQAAASRDLASDFKKLKNDVITNIQHLIENLGLYSVMSTIGDMIEEVKGDKLKESNKYYSSDTHDRLYRRTTQCLEAIRVICEDVSYRSGMNELDKLLNFSTNKFHRLLDIYRQEKDEDDEENKHFNNLSCITFVERKSVAVHLAAMLTRLSILDPEFAEFRIDYVHAIDNGFSTKTYKFNTEIGQAERKRLQDVLSKFRRQELNVLVATKVVEEGLDVRSCNLVIKYDFPKEFRSYVQSKGRARKRPSKYIMMVNNSGEQELYRKYVEVEKISLEECHTMPDENSDDEEEETESFTADPDQPDVTGTVNGSQAISLVYQYISKIPVDRFTKLVPAWKTKVCSGSSQDSLLAGLGQNSESGFSVTCYMPHKTPFVFPVEGPIRPTKDRAKRACALEIVRMLYEYGELTIRLKVKKRERLCDTDDEDEEDDARGRKTGTRRKRHFYAQKLPAPLSGQLGNFGYLYQVEMVLGTEIHNARYSVYRPQEDNVTLGIISSNKIPNIGPLQLYGPSGDIKVSIRLYGQVDLEPEFIKKAEKFHDYAFTKVLKIARVEAISGGFLVVPLQDGVVNFDLCRDRNNDKLTKQSVITPKYKDGTDHYFIEDFLRSHNPKMQMNENKATYVQYFKTKYNIDIQNLDQPLLRISSADKRLFMYKPGGEAVKDSTSEDMNKRTLLVPELVSQANIPSGLWKQIQVIPFCLERMSSLVHAAELSARLTGLPAGPEDLSIKESWFSTKPRNKGLMARLMKFDAGLPLENLDLLEPLTLKGTDDVFNMERLEVLGDVFLKYRTSMFLYYCLIADSTKNKTNADEGELTLLRSKVVGNKNLFRIATLNLGLQHGSVNSVKIEPHTTFMPPGFTAPSELRLIQLDAQLPDQIKDDQRRATLSVGSLLNYLNYNEMDQDDAALLSLAVQRVVDKEAAGGFTMREHRLVSDKSLADVIEALIGCFLIHTGQNNTLKVMARMGLDMTGGKPDLVAAKADLLDHVPNMNTQKVVEFSPEKTAFKNVRLGSDPSSAQKLYARLPVSEVETKIGYTFREKSFLLQAFTHSSYSENNLTDSYERLEYLGDAVLDYLVTCYIYTNSDADPGRLTDIRSALVCNNTFAALLVDLGLHGNILYSAPEVRKKIVDYVDSRKYEDNSSCNNSSNRDYSRSISNSHSNSLVNNLKLINESEPPEAKEIEVPKLLGDVLEALVGAVFIDSGHDLEKAWNVFLRFKPRLEEFIERPPMNPKKLLFEACDSVEFGSADVRNKDVKVSVTINKNNKEYKFAGLGNNKRMAEIAASKQALKHLGLRNH